MKATVTDGIPVPVYHAEPTLGGSMPATPFSVGSVGLWAPGNPSAAAPRSCPASSARRRS